MTALGRQRPDSERLSPRPKAVSRWALFRNELVFADVNSETMHQIHIGNESEFVQIAVRKLRGTADWIRGDTQIKVRGFTAQISADFEPTDFQTFGTEIGALYENLGGEALLRPREKQLTLTLRGNGRGGIKVVGCAWFVACYGSKLDFEFEIDQTFLPSILEQVSGINSFPQVGKD